MTEPRSNLEENYHGDPIVTGIGLHGDTAGKIRLSIPVPIKQRQSPVWHARSVSWWSGGLDRGNMGASFSLESVQTHSIPKLTVGTAKPLLTAASGDQAQRASRGERLQSRTTRRTRIPEFTGNGQRSNDLRPTTARMKNCLSLE